MLIGVGIWSRLPRGESSRSSPLTLAVLPFTNLSGDPTREYVAEGLAEDTATSLGQIDPEQMGVVAGSSTVRYKGSTKSAAEIGRELAADYIVESSLRVEDNRLRVTATLVRVRDQVQVWSQSYDREPTSVLGLQRELSARHRRADPAPPVAWPSGGTGATTDAEPRCIRSVPSGPQLRESAHARDQPTGDRVLHARHRAGSRLWAGLVRDRQGACGQPHQRRRVPSEVLPRARAAAVRAVRAGPDTAEAQFALAYLKWCCEWDWPGAEAGFRRALALDPRLRTRSL